MNLRCYLLHLYIGYISMSNTFNSSHHFINRDIYPKYHICHVISKSFSSCNLIQPANDQASLFNPFTCRFFDVRIALFVFTIQYNSRLQRVLHTILTVRMLLNLRETAFSGAGSSMLESTILPITVNPISRA